MNRSTSNSEHFLETLKRLFDNGARGFTLKVTYMADPEGHYRRWSPFTPKSYIMSYELEPIEAEEIPTNFYDPELSEKITEEGRRLINRLNNQNPICNCSAEDVPHYHNKIDENN
jgi:hypothetical protein